MKTITSLSIAKLLNWFKNQWLLAILLVIFVAISYALWQYTSPRLANDDYMGGMVGNMIATLVGVIFGVPIAFEIERRLRTQDEQQKRSENEQRAKTIASLLKKELDYNGEQLGVRFNHPDIIPLIGFKFELWQALSDSGEIQWLDKPKVLSEVANAYHHIKVVARLENLAYEYVRSPVPIMQNSPSSAEPILNDSHRHHCLLADSLCKAIKVIEREYDLRPLGIQYVDVEAIMKSFKDKYPEST